MMRFIFLSVVLDAYPMIETGAQIFRQGFERVSKEWPIRKRNMFVNVLTVWRTPARVSMFFTCSTIGVAER